MESSDTGGGILIRYTPIDACGLYSHEKSVKDGYPVVSQTPVEEQNHDNETDTCSIQKHK